MEFRMAERGDIEKFLKNRMDFVCQIRDIKNKDMFEEKTREYLKKHIESDDFVAFIALDGEKIVSACMACIYEIAPMPSCPSGKVSELLNVNTAPIYRRKGYAEKLIRMLIEELKRRNVGKLLLDYTDEGRPLYQKLGFEELPHQMKMTLN